MQQAYNLSQDQTLQFNLCIVNSLAAYKEASLTQNTEKAVLSNCPIFLVNTYYLRPAAIARRFTSIKRPHLSAVIC